MKVVLKTSPNGCNSKFFYDTIEYSFFTVGGGKE